VTAFTYRSRRSGALRVTARDGRDADTDVAAALNPFVVPLHHDGADEEIFKGIMGKR
jgi:hypothetical protein